MPKKIQMHADIAVNDKGMEWLKAAINLYNNNLNSREDRIDFKILTTEEFANRIAADLNHVKLQNLPEAQTLMNRRAGSFRTW